MNTPSNAADDNSAAANRGGQMTAEQQTRAAAAVRAEWTTKLMGAGLGCGLPPLVILGLLAFTHPPAPVASYLLFGGLLVLAGLFVVVLWGQRGRRLAEVRAGQVARATGHVEFITGRYQAAAPGGALDLTGFKLAAGTYDFSYLPMSRRVVAAELAAADTPAEAQAALRHALAVANHFNLDDLPAYRQGQLGPGTGRRLVSLWAPSGWLLLAALGLLAAALVGVPGTGLLAGLLVALWAVISGRRVLRRTQDVLGGTVRAAEGEVRSTKHTRQSGRTLFTDYSYSVAGQNFLVTAAAQRALLAGQRYRLYYLPRSRALVGIEPLE